jgi:hypothetical protein
VTRGLYAQLGVGSYLAGYQQLRGFLESCNETAGLVCPPTTATPVDAQQALLNHADNVFSSVTTAGSPLPMWSKGDGTGNLFEGTSPVGGSGIDMSANLFSLVAYLDLNNYGSTTAWSPLYTNGYADPVTPDGNWASLVEPNPVPHRQSISDNGLVATSGMSEQLAGHRVMRIVISLTPNQ